MRLRRPPPLADWLLKRFVAGGRNESLLGDLIEEYQAGRTSVWYWRETIAALLIFARREVLGLLSRCAARRSRLIRLSVTAFAAVGFCGAALAWASTISRATHPQVCAPSSGIHAARLHARKHLR